MSGPAVAGGGALAAGIAAASRGEEGGLGVAGSEMMAFNVRAGLAEARVRGLRGGLLGAREYAALEQCETVDDCRALLQATSYGSFLAGEPPPLMPAAVVARATGVLVEQWNRLRCEATGRLGEFLDRCTHAHMIDNLVLVLSGTLRGCPADEVLERCNPLGMFETLPVCAAAESPAELFHIALEDSPLAPYFRVSELSSEDLTEVNIEILRNRLYRTYLEAFREFCMGLGGATAEVMGAYLNFEADRRVISVCCNSLGSELGRDDRLGLFPSFVCFTLTASRSSPPVGTSRGSSRCLAAIPCMASSFLRRRPPGATRHLIWTAFSLNRSRHCAATPSSSSSTSGSSLPTFGSKSKRSGTSYGPRSAFVSGNTRAYPKAPYSESRSHSFWEVSPPPILPRPPSQEPELAPV